VAGAERRRGRSGRGGKRRGDVGIEKAGDVGREGDVKLWAGHGEPWGGARGGGRADVGVEVPPPVGVKVCDDVVEADELLLTFFSSYLSWKAS
jgi:hypothetical protein